MSIPVAIDDLVAATSDYGFAYVLTVRDDETPHVVAVTPTWTDGVATMNVGRGTLHNALRQSSISLCYPPLEQGGYSLIVDGAASITSESTLVFSPSGAVLHRPAAHGEGGSATGCSNDCAPIPGSA